MGTLRQLLFIYESVCHHDRAGKKACQESILTDHRIGTGFGKDQTGGTSGTMYNVPGTCINPPNALTVYVLHQTRQSNLMKRVIKLKQDCVNTDNGLIE